MTFRSIFAILVTASGTLAAGLSAAPALRRSPPTFHLRLVRSEPAKDEVLAAPPTVVRLWFSLAPELAVTTVKLATAEGKPVVVGPLRRGSGANDPVEARMTAALVPGRYSVAWKTSSTDGHAMRGAFSFTVRAASR